LELKLWKILGKEDGPWGFIPQFTMSGYLLDFFSPTCNICLEADGPEHTHRKAHDAQRDKVLAEQGVRTLRISAGDLNIYTPHAIISLIESFIAQVQVQSPAPQAQASKATTHAQ
jgi:very-short-patch-repair endonuclease